VASLAAGNVSPRVKGSMAGGSLRLTNDEWSTGNDSVHGSIVELAEIGMNDTASAGQSPTNVL